jgi:Zn-dependent protease with chaperone function
MLSFALTLACLSNHSSSANDGVTLDLGKDSPALHMPVGDQIVFAVPAFEDYSEMMFDLCEAMGLKIADECQIYTMNASIGINAIATVAEGNRLIVYDRRLSPLVGYTGAMTIIAHELGHHFCRHVGEPGNPKRELEADRFAGAAMRMAGFALNEALAAVPILAERPSKSHPGRSTRIETIRRGWTEPETGKTCRK